MPHQCTACGHTFEDGSKEMLSGCPDCGGTTFQFRPSGAAGNDDSADAPPSDDAPETPPDRGSRGVAERMGRTATAMRDWMHGDDPDGSGRPGESAEPAEASRDARPDAPTADASRPNDADAPAAPGTSGADASSSTTDPPARQASEADSAPADDEEGADDAPSTAWPDPPDVSHVREGDARRRRDARRSVDETPEGSEAGEAATDEDGLIVADEEPVDGAAEDTAQASARSEMARPDELPPRGERDAPTSGRVVSEPSGEKPDMAELRAELNEQFESIKILEPGQYELNLMELYDRQEYIIALQENGRYVIQMPEDWIGDRPD